MKKNGGNMMANITYEIKIDVYRADGVPADKTDLGYIELIKSFEKALKELHITKGSYHIDIKSVGQNESRSKSDF
jgi:hypothetical protein